MKKQFRKREKKKIEIKQEKTCSGKSSGKKEKIWSTTTTKI